MEKDYVFAEKAKKAKTRSIMMNILIKLTENLLPKFDIVNIARNAFWSTIITLLIYPIWKGFIKRWLSYRLGKEVHKFFRAFKFENMPNRIILIRHAESKGNVNSSTYASVPDYRISLTTTGVEQAKRAGRLLQRIVGEETLRVYCSPYLRARQTIVALLGAFEEEKKESDIPSHIDTNENSLDETSHKHSILQCYKVQEDLRLREQEVGFGKHLHDVNGQLAKKQFHGHLYYRFPGGESAADVYDRVSAFVERLHRLFQNEKCAQNFIVVSHGSTIRILLMRLLNLSVEETHGIDNVENAEIVVLEKTQDGSFRPTTPLRRRRVRPYPGDGANNVLQLFQSKTQKNDLYRSISEYDNKKDLSNDSDVYDVPSHSKLDMNDYSIITVASNPDILFQADDNLSSNIIRAGSAPDVFKYSAKSNNPSTMPNQ